MTYRRILTWPNQGLLKATAQVDFNKDSLDDITSDVNDLVDTLNVEMGLGLAAPQIGIPKSIVVVDTSHLGQDIESLKGVSLYKEKYLVLINPSLELSGEDVRWSESCLSVPGFSANVSRKSAAALTYTDMFGEENKINASWPLSGILQHECDHLSGTLYLRHASHWDRSRIQKKILKLKKQKEKLAKEAQRRERLELKGIDPDSPAQRRLENQRKKKTKKRKKNNGQRKRR